MQLDASSVRRSVKGAYANGSLWGLGNGLVNATLMIYIAREHFNASGVAISCLLATPPLVGLLRLLTPLWIDRVGNRRAFCVATFLASACSLAVLPILAGSGLLARPWNALLALIATWTAHNLFDYFGAIALWSWFGDLVPPRVRGRFLGRRESFLLCGTIAGSALAVVGTWKWEAYCSLIERPDLATQAYFACTWFGAAAFALATLPLCRMDRAERAPREQRSAFRVRFRDLWSPFADRDYRRLLMYEIWLSMANGLIQTPRNVFLVSVVRLSLAEKKSLDAVSRGAQSVMLPWVGRLVDRRGNVRILATCQIIVAIAPLFFVLANPDAKWWLIGAYVCWVAYGGVNVALPNLMLGLSRDRDTASYAAARFASGQAAYAISVIAGGLLFDWLRTNSESLQIAGRSIDLYVALFTGNAVLLAIGAGLALRIEES